MREPDLREPGPREPGLGERGLRELDLETWPRRDHFELFRHYRNPFFHVTVEVDATALYEASREEGGPGLFAGLLHASLVAVQATEEMRYRLRGDRVVVHEVVHGGSTVLRHDDTFGFGYYAFDPDYRRFEAAVRAEVDRVAASTELVPASGDNLVQYSILPWFRFSSFRHAWPGGDDSIPKIVFGRVSRQGDSWAMPVSVDVHHALMDGLHVSRWLERFERELARDWPAL